MFHLTFFLVLCAGLYFLPAIIGSKKHNATAILAVNVLLGWTVIGWIVALVWALSEGPVPGMPGWAPSGPGPQGPPYTPPQHYAPPQQYAPPAPQPSPYRQPAPQEAVSPTPQGRYCSKCGSALRAGDKFCAACGSEVPGA
jgi:Superinfection immunity protein/zinc-ribbon domain